MVKITIEITTNEKSALEVMRLLQGEPEQRIDTPKLETITLPKAEKPEEKRPSFHKEWKSPVKKWSEKYDCCQGCGTTGRKHMGKGLCTCCYMAKRQGREISSKTSEEKKNERELLGLKICGNSKCPYQPSDYRQEDMVQSKKTGKWYCDDGCREETEGGERA